MKATVRYGLIFAGLYAAVKLGVFAADLQHDTIGVLIVPLSNLLFMLLAIFLGLFSHRKTLKGEETTFVTDFKGAMQSGLVYILGVGAFVVIYYKVIDANFFQDKADAWMAMVEDPDFDWSIMEEQYPQLTREDIVDRERQSTVKMSLKQYLPMTVMGMLALALFYTILVVILFRRVLSRFR